MAHSGNGVESDEPAVVTPAASVLDNETVIDLIRRRCQPFAKALLQHDVLEAVDENFEKVVLVPFLGQKSVSNDH